MPRRACRGGGLPLSSSAELAREAVITGGITGGGEAMVSTAGEGVRHAAGRLFGRLQSRYAQQRAGWLEGELLGDMLAELRRGAELPQSGEFTEVKNAVHCLREIYSEVG